MGLSANITAKLDAGTLVQTLLRDLGGPLASLGAITPPANGAAIGGATSGTAQIHSSGVGAAVSQVTQLVEPLLASLPGVDSVLGPLSTALELVDRIGTGDLAGQVQALVDRLSQELSGSHDGGFVAILLRLGDVLSTAPEGRVLLDLLQSLLRAGGGNLPAGTLSFPNVLPAIDGTVKVIGGLMALESVLSEADRLTGLMAQQFDPATVQPAVAAALAAFGDGPTALADFLAHLDPAQPAEVDAAVTALGAAAARLGELRDLLSTAMGFGEATLVYLDVDQVQTELTTAASMVRTADVDPIQRSAQSVADLLTPLLHLDLSGLPSFDLPGLLAALEGKVEGFAAQIRAFDTAALAAPLAQGLGAVTGAIHSLADVLARVTATIRSALESVRQAVAALPFDTIANAIRDVLQPVTAVLDAIRQLIAGIETALHTAVDATTQALTAVEHLVDQFKTEVEALFGQAKVVVEQVHIDQVVDQVTNLIKAFDDVLAKAQMQPYFDTAIAAVGTAADVISAVPFALLPDSMKADVETAVQPIRDADAGAVQVEIEQLLEITDGKFALRPEIEKAIADVQASYDALITAVKAHSPHALVAQIDVKLAEVAAKIHDLSPQLTLQPVQDAIDHVKATIAGFDLRKELKPVDDAFAKILQALDRFSPDQLIAPLDEKVKQARDKVVTTIHLDQWGPAIDSVVAQANGLLARFDPTQLAPKLQSALAEATDLLDRFPDVSLLGGFGNLAALLLSGSGLRVYPWTFGVVTGWLGAGGGTTDLLARSGRIADAVSRTKDAVAAVDLTALALQLGAKIQAVQAAMAGNAALAAGSPERLRLEAATGGLDANAALAPLAGNRDRYLAALTRSASLGETLRRIGLSEVDATIVRLRAAFAPLHVINDFLRDVARRLGFPGLEQGLVPALKNLLAVATPERLTGIVMPIFIALRDRVDALLQAVVTPIQAAIAELNHLVAEIDLGPLRQSVDAVFQEIRAQIESLQPSRLLAQPLASFDALKLEVAGFDPLKDLLAIVNALRDTIERILGKLKAEEILASPLAIYDHILAELSKLDIDPLLTPVLDQLDAIAAQVDTGLTGTVAAFRRLQDSLPSGDGGAAGALAGAAGDLAGSVSVSVGF